uniref:DUF4378 domain-containing protein n=1 Tax=Nelumbo nucifera TaxID=4432 RepID=A0A822YZE2_NELNU|nr:TPA_asm: hypothetical protein HUJ06_008538 [Nelumbo nucifera]
MKRCIDFKATTLLLLHPFFFFRGNSSCDTSALHRKLVFDTIAEIINSKKQLRQLKAFSGTNSMIGKPSLQQIWSEFRRIRERDPTKDLVEIICRVLHKDMAEDDINGWGDCPEEMPKMVLDSGHRTNDIQGSGGRDDSRSRSL